MHPYKIVTLKIILNDKKYQYQKGFSLLQCCTFFLTVNLICIPQLLQGEHVSDNNLVANFTPNPLISHPLILRMHHHPASLLASLQDSCRHQHLLLPCRPSYSPPTTSPPTASPPTTSPPTTS